MRTNVTAPPSTVNSTWSLVLFAAVVAAALKLWLVIGVDLGKDEAAYWYWSQRFDASYAAVPLAAIRLASILGDSETTLRCPLIALGAVTTVLMFSWCLRNGLERGTATWATIVFATSHWVWYTSSYLHPDGFLIPLWLSALCTGDLVLQCPENAGTRRKIFRHGLLGACCGLAVLSKYSGAGLALGILVWVAVRDRSHGIALGATAAGMALTSSPLLFSMVESGFHLPATLNSLSRIVADQPVLLRAGAFICSPLLFISLPLWISIVTCFSRLLHRLWLGRRRPDDRLMLVLLPAIITVLTFAWFAVDRGQIKGNWILPSMVGLWPFAFGAALPNGGSATLDILRRRWFLAPLVIMGVIQAGAVSWTLKFPAIAGDVEKQFGEGLATSYHNLVSPSDQVREPSRSWNERLCEYHGWARFASELEKHATTVDAAGRIPVISNQYQLVFAQAFYGNRTRPVFTLDDPKFRDVSDLWAHQSAPDSLLFVAAGRPPLPTSLRDYHPAGEFEIVRKATGCAPNLHQMTLLYRNGLTQ